MKYFQQVLLLNLRNPFIGMELFKKWGTGLIPVIFLVFEGFFAVSLAQPRAIKNAIKEIEKENGIFAAYGKGNTLENARQDARKQIEQKILAKFRVSEPITTNGSLQDEVDEQQLRVKLRQLPMNAKELTWGKTGNDEVYLYVSDYEAKNYAVQRATIRYRNAQLYNFGEAFSEKQDDAIAVARGNLITQFSAKITTETNLTTSEKTVNVNQSGTVVNATTEQVVTDINGKVDDRFLSSNKVSDIKENMTGTVFEEEFTAKNRVFAQMTLQGLQTISLNLGNEWYAFTYITLEDKAKSFETVKSKIIASADEADRAFTNGNLVSGLKGYYKTYILADTYYENLPYSFLDGTRTENLQESMRSKIDVLLKDQVSVLARPAYLIDEKDIVAPFQILYKDNPLNGLLYQFKFQSYNFTEVLRNGRGRLNLPGYVPEYPKEEFTINLFIDISDDLKSDPTIKELEDIKRLSVSKSIQVNFTNIFKYSVKGTFFGKRVDLELENIDPKLVREVRWVLGDGEERYTSEPKLSYTYEESGQFELDVELNAEPSLGIKRYVDLDSKRIRTKEGAREPIAVVEQITKEEKDNSAIADMSALANTNAPKKLNINQAYKEISESNTTKGLLTLLTNKKAKGELIFGKQADLPDSEGALILVADQEKVYERLVFSQNRFYKVDTGTEVVSLVESYRGKYLIWVKKN
ncbi:hypothetical protein EP331_00930 [bacterium]|nr:MAG: hypothetical protein EP331_00930 [bacterium]